MTRPALGAPSLDSQEPGRLRDLVLAQVALLQSVDTNQHALMSAWGGPAICHNFYATPTGNATYTATFRMPPGVTDCDVSLLLGGIGIVTITTAADSTGTALSTTSGYQPEFADWVSTGGVAPTSAGATSGRAVTVASSASWAWADVDFTLTVTGVSGTLYILAIELRPIHVSR